MRGPAIPGYGELFLRYPVSRASSILDGVIR